VLNIFSFVVLFMGYFVSIFKILALPAFLPLLLYSPFFMLSFLSKKTSIREIGLFFIILVFSFHFFLNDSGSSFGGLKQSIFCFVSFSLLRRCSDDSLRNAIKPLVIMSLMLGITGLLQLLGVEPFVNFAPLPSSDFISSGGFGPITLSRPNFALGNSINTGTFFGLSIFLLLFVWDEFKASHRFLIMSIFLIAVILTLSRSAILGVVLLMPLLIERAGKRTVFSLIILVFFLGYEWIFLIFKRFFNSSYRVGSDSERIEIFTKFFDSLDYQTVLIGNTISSDMYLITDGLIFYNVARLGVIITLIYLFLLVYPVRLERKRRTQYLILLVLFLTFSFINNSFHAYYNIFLLIFCFRLMSCSFPTRSFCQSSTVRSS
jgi:hypothetical protein